MFYLNLQTDWQALLVDSCHLKLEAQTSKKKKKNSEKQHNLV